VQFIHNLCTKKAIVTICKLMHAPRAHVVRINDPHSLKISCCLRWTWAIEWKCVWNRLGFGLDSPFTSLYQVDPSTLGIFLTQLSTCMDYILFVPS